MEETFRLGPTMVDIIKKVLPWCHRMQSARLENEDTLFLSVLFERSPFWVYVAPPAPEEAMRDDLFFVHALQIIAFEIVLLDLQGARESKDGIIVIAFRSAVLDALELLLHYKLSAVCSRLRNGLLGLPASDGAATQYEYTALRARESSSSARQSPLGGLIAG